MVKLEFKNILFLMERVFKVRSFFTIFDTKRRVYFEKAIDNPCCYCLRFIERIKRRRFDEMLLNPLH